MLNKENSAIFVNHKNKSLEIVSTIDIENLNSGIIGPYLSMYYQKYMLYSWVNWTRESQPSLQIIQDITRELEYEEYIFSVIVEEGMIDDRVDEIIKLLGYVPDYILEKNNGVVNILHQTNHIDILSTVGYILNDIDNGEGNYSFGRGVYCLDYDNFVDQDGWINSDNVYKGKYVGEYLRCIEDTNNGLKCGSINKFQQEVIIPFTESKIKWDK